MSTPQRKTEYSTVAVQKMKQKAVKDEPSYTSDDKSLPAVKEATGSWASYVSKKLEYDLVSDNEIELFRKNGTLPAGKSYGDMWYASISIRIPEHIPKCQNCQDDKKRLSVYKGNPNDFKRKCSVYCLQHEWFFGRRGGSSDQANESLAWI